MRVSKSEYIRLLEVEKELKTYKELMNRPAQSGFDYRDWPIILPSANKTISIELMEWGFLPTWLKNDQEVSNFRRGYKDEIGKYHPAYTTLNAKGENLFTNEEGTKASIYKEAALNRRCLVPSTGFFEWRHLPKIGKKGQALKATEKYPYYIFMPQQEIMYMAGIWQTWTNWETKEERNTFAIVTSPANEMMTEIHNTKKRMPTIFSEDEAYAWCFGELTQDDISALGTTTYDRKFMDAYTVDKDFLHQPEPNKFVEQQEVPPLIRAL